MVTVRALAFDAYGTLFDVHSVVAALELLAGERASELSELWRRKQLEYSWLRALMGRYHDFETVTAEALDFALEALGLELESVAKADLVAAYRRLDPYPEVPAALTALAAYPRVVLSNGSPAMLAAAVAHAGLDDRLDAVLSADAVGTYKTDPRVYQLAHTYLGGDPAEILFCSSNAWDIAGAKAFGFSCCWVARSAAPAEHLGLAADVTVADLNGLVAHLRG